MWTRNWEYNAITRYRTYTRTDYDAAADHWTWPDTISATLEAIDPDDTIAILDTLGQSGWELISVVARSGMGSADSSGFSSEETFYFKRALGIVG